MYSSLSHLRPELKPVEKDVEVVIKFPEVENLNPPVLTIDEVSFKYPNTDRVIFSGVNLGANSESRICIVGENGAGKTTLLKIMMGINSPSSGIVHHHRGLKFGYFSQHFVDQLEMNVSCVELLQREFPGKPIEEYRRQLGSFGVSGDMALQLVASLSGGQKSRVAFAKMCMGRKYQHFCSVTIFNNELFLLQHFRISSFLTNLRIILTLKPLKHLERQSTSSVAVSFSYLTTKDSFAWFVRNFGFVQTEL